MRSRCHPRQGVQAQRADLNTKANASKWHFRLREGACRKVKLVLELRRGTGNDFFEAALEAAADVELARLRGEVEPAVLKMAEMCVVEKTKS